MGFGRWEGEIKVRTEGHERLVIEQRDAKSIQGTCSEWICSEGVDSLMTELVMEFVESES